MQPKITLYHYWRSSCSWRVRWAMALKGVAYESVAVNILADEQRSAAYLAKNPAGFLPALAIDDVFYGESMALIEWIEEMWPLPPILPSNKDARLHVRQLALTIVAGTQPLQNPALVKHFVADEAARKPHMQHWIQRGLAVYETLLHQGSPGVFSYGDHVTLADLCLVPQIYNALRFDVDMGAFPLSHAIYRRCLKTAACDQAAPHNQPGAPQ